MADILKKYGIKEVADVTFYERLSETEIGAPVLFLDTLKVSTIEQTAENTSARGGKGNPELIIWDYNKEITVTLEDALFSAKSMAVMFGHQDDDGKLAPITTNSVVKTIDVAGATAAPTQFKVNGQAFSIPSNASWYTVDGTSSSTWSTSAVYCTFDWSISEGATIVISADRFPGTYYVTGDTYARSEETGKDEMFQFIIPKAKVQSEVTLTLEAEGDPTTFSMNLKVLRPKDKQMMKLVKYNFPS